jgi:hypothetical protein
VIIFISVRFLSKKITKPNLKKKKQNQTETGSNRPVSVQFGSVILEQKPKPKRLVSVRFDYFIFKTKNYIIFWVFVFVISNGFGCGLARFFSIWLFY